MSLATIWVYIQVKVFIYYTHSHLAWKLMIIHNDCAWWCWPKREILTNNNDHKPPPLTDHLRFGLRRSHKSHTINTRLPRDNHGPQAYELGRPTFAVQILISCVLMCHVFFGLPKGQIYLFMIFFFFFFEVRL